MTETDISYENYKIICDQADTAYEHVITLTGLDYNKHIVIVSNEEINNHTPYISYDYYDTIFLHKNYFIYYNEHKAEVLFNLRSEITHLLLTSYCGSKDSFFFGEGIAEYIGHKKIKDYADKEIKKNMIEILISLSYYDIFLDSINEDTSYYYRILCRDFTAFWCETFGIHTYYLLYAEVTANNYKEKMKKFSGMFSRVIKNPEDHFEIKNLSINQIYKLSIDYDYSACLFYPDYWENLPSYNFHSSRKLIEIKDTFYSEDRQGCFFKPIEEENLILSLEGNTGLAYTIKIEPIIKTFTPDTFEPDNGPISSTAEIIEDSGWDEYQSQSHSLFENDIDWFKFIPQPYSTYQFYLILEDAYYDELCAEVFKVRIRPMMIKPDGYTELYYDKDYQGHSEYDFIDIPISPVQNNDYISWTNSSDSNETWFFKVATNNELRYSIRVIKSITL